MYESKILYFKCLENISTSHKTHNTLFNAWFKFVKTQVWLTCIALVYMGRTGSPDPVSFIVQIFATYPDAATSMSEYQT